MRIKAVHPGLKLKLKPTQVLAVGFAVLILVGGISLSLPVASKTGKV